MNLRTILLKKTKLLNTDSFKKNLQLDQLTLKPWVAIGHFDVIYSYQLDTRDRNVFATIHENNSAVAAKNDESTYYHPLYLLTDQDDTDLWQRDSWFISITRIHLASTVTGSDVIRELSDYISYRCKSQECYCHVYQTIELSDLTVVAKSNNLSNMLSIILNLWAQPNIGKLYTYFGVEYEFLKNFDKRPDESDIINFLSMRFAIRNSKNVDAFFQIVKKELGDTPTYSIAGVDDVVLNFNELKVQKFVNFLRSWLVSGLPREIDLTQTFSDITTRLGTSYNRDESDNINESDNPKSTPSEFHSLEQLCIKLTELCKDVQQLSREKLNSPIDKYWLRSLSELSYSLLRLSRVASLDEFVYLMLPGAKAFLQNLKEALNNDFQGDSVILDRESLYLFVDNWSHLMEHVMRLEGQLVHQPETRPILYDLPLAMLEQILALLDLCSQILQINDNPKKDIQFILFPKLCSVIEAEEIFVANSQNPGLLSISIPFHMMYDPKTIQIALCHEIAHFVGENHRNRELRRECYFHAAAILIADLIFETEHKAFIEQIYQMLMKYSYCCDTKAETISKDESCIQQWTCKLLYCETTTVYRNLIQGAVKKAIDIEDNMNSNRLVFSVNFPVLQERYRQYFAVILPKLTMLFREVFADICMVCLLDLNAETYFDSLSGGIIENPGSIEFTAVRIFSTLLAIGKPMPKQYSFPDNELGKQLFQSMQRLKAKQPTRDTESGNYQFPITCVQQLQAYAQKCATDIKKQLSDGSTAAMMEKLRFMFNNVISKNMNSERLREFINGYRKKCLRSVNKE